MRRVLLFFLLNLLSYGALHALGGWLRERRFFWIFWSGAVLALGAWAVPVWMGHGIHGSLPGVLPFRIFATFWLIALLGVVALSLPLLLLRFLARLGAKRMGVRVVARGVSGGAAGVDAGGAERAEGSLRSEDGLRTEGRLRTELRSENPIRSKDSARSDDSVSTESSEASTESQPALVSPRDGEVATPAVSRAPQAKGLGRRQLLGNLSAAVPLLSGLGSITGVASGVAGFKVRRFEVDIEGLPQELDGFRIGQITDVHVGPFIRVDELARAVDVMNEERCHLQVLTGDLIDDLSELDGTMAALDRCKAPHGMVAVLGNHEHWRGVERIREGFAKTQVRLLVNECERLEVQGKALRVVGVDYPMRSFGPQAEVMERSATLAFAATRPDETVLCLSHHPDFFPHAAKNGAHLTLAGHTHGGQVVIFGIPVLGFAFEHMLGWYQRGKSRLYVSGGTGHWLPFRLGVPPEVSILTLKRV